MTLRLVIEAIKGVGYGVAAVLLVAWLLTGNEELVHWQIVVAAIAAAILFDPVVTGVRLVKRWVRVVTYRMDDTDALWEADWKSSRARRRRSLEIREGRRWVGATLGTILAGAFVVAPVRDRSIV